ncbi:GLUG motif-containing protein, partial [Parabacteroides timonensis]|uniref:GLUG motif-containing protein n=1 Tax=Parabacteroides timonensis TaxID=1871013 RepID=UPI00293715E3
MRKLILVLNILVMMVCAVWGQDGVWNGEVAGNLEPVDEDGNVYHISTAAELAKLADLVNAGDNFADKTVILQNDIVLNVGVLDGVGELKGGRTEFHPWTPIGKDDEKPFKGTFDGNGKKVSGVYILDDNNESTYLGLFGYLGEDGKIENVGVEDSYVKGTTGQYVYYVGGVCGYSSGGSISNSYNAGSVTGETKETGEESYVGGVCGSSYYGRISNCYNIGSVTGEG